MFKSKSSCVSPKMQGNDKLEHLRIFLGCKIPKNKGLEKHLLLISVVQDCSASHGISFAPFGSYSYLFICHTSCGANQTLKYLEYIWFYSKENGEHFFRLKTKWISKGKPHVWVQLTEVKGLFFSSLPPEVF